MPQINGARLPTTAPVLSCRPRLLLRGHSEHDLSSIVEMCEDAEMQRWTTVPVPYLPGYAKDYLAHVRQGWQTGAVAAFAIELDDRFAGNIDLRLEEGSWAEVGYATAPWARGQGVMSCALKTALLWGFTALSLDGFHWRAHAGNEASKRVAAKCGFKFEGTARALLVQRGRRVDGWMASLVPSELSP